MENVLMADNGRLVVPAGLRHQLGMPKGGKMVAFVRDGVLVLEPFDVAVRRVQAFAQSYRKPGSGSVVDEFLAERRQEGGEEANG
jgi:bifunctional DNA-binding transcriptional regulator/antitoxin component of YhaV-PrlF toxin-antitoxin module